eukprot:jgi/Mesvir1/12756/Mv26051-RA.2
MASKKLERIVGLEARDVTLLRARANITTAQELLSCTTIELLEKVDSITIDRLENLITNVSKAVRPVLKTAWVMYSDRVAASQGCYHLPLQLPELDATLRGGLPIGSIVELVGPAGVGKTQVCLMATAFTSVHTNDPSTGFHGHVLYIDTENKFNSMRVVEIAQARFPQGIFDESAIEQMMGRITVVRPASTSAFMALLDELDALVVGHRVRLIVVDSIAALARSEFGGNSMLERSTALAKQASRLKFVAETFGVVVLLTNQIVALRGGAGHGPALFEFDAKRRLAAAAQPVGGVGGWDADMPEAGRAGRPEAAPGGAFSGAPSDPGRQHQDGFVTAALGTLWAHAVNTRLVLEMAADPLDFCVA